MRNFLVVLGAGVLFIAGCREQDYYINFGTAGTLATDTTYVLPATSIPAADAHNVLVEEFSGQSCDNCVAGHNDLQVLVQSGHVHVISLYFDDGSHTGPSAPPPGAVHDFRSPIAALIQTSIFGDFQGLPSGGVDRVPVSGAMTLGRADWTSAVNARKPVTDSLNLEITSTFNSGIATITATVKYLQPMSTRQNLSIVIVEDSMVDKQETGVNTYDNAYLYTDIFRDMVTSAPLGDPILSSMATKEAGRVYSKRYTYTPKIIIPAILPNHCRVIAFVNSPGGTGGDFHVLQSVQCKLVP